MSLSTTFTTGQTFTVTNNRTTPINTKTIYLNDFTPNVFLDDSVNTLIKINFNDYSLSPSGLSSPEPYVNIFNTNQEICGTQYNYNYDNKEDTWYSEDIKSNYKFNSFIPGVTVFNNFNSNYTFDHIYIFTKNSTSLFGTPDGQCAWSNFRMTYEYLPYLLNITTANNNYSSYGKFYITSDNSTDTSFKISVSLSKGYRLVGYNINNTYIPTTRISFTIDPSPYLINNVCNIELIYEPITFTAICKSIQLGNSKIVTDISTINVTYNEDAFLPTKPIDTEEFIYFGWIQGSSSDTTDRPQNNNSDIRAWISNNQITWINDSKDYRYSLSYYNNSTQYPSNYNLKNFSTDHNAIYYFYYWIVPQCHKISYEWLDDLTNERACYQLPKVQYPRYNIDTIEVATIPLFNKYTVENAHTKNWYYYDDNNELQTNNLTTISSTNNHDITFYGRKSLASENGSYITWTVNNPDWGEIDYYQTKPDDDYYDAASTVTVQAIANNKRKFLKWNDNDTNSFKSETAGTTDRNYVATLVSQAYAGKNPVNDVYVGTTPVRAIYQGTTCVYERGD